MTDLEDLKNLKPCPFCGSQDPRSYFEGCCDDPDGTTYYIKCQDCWAMSDHYKDLSLAYAAWNRRVQKTPDYPSEPLAFIEHRCKNCGHIDAIKIGSKNR